MKTLITVISLSIVLMMAGCSLTDSMEDVGGVSAPAPVQVRLISANSYVHYKYGSTYQRAFLVRVQNLAYTKNVFIRQLLTNGSWTNMAASYAGAADAGFEYWSLNTSEYYGSVMSNRFAVGYTVNGVTYWDNNNGADYRLAANDGYVLGNGINVLGGYTYLSAYDNTLNGVVEIRNLAYTKDVKVWYSTDNWATKKSVTASFMPVYYYGYATVKCPNQWGFERWQFRATNVVSGAVKYYFEYKVNGVTYYDNNFGMNYQVNRQ